MTPNHELYAHGPIGTPAERMPDEPSYRKALAAAKRKCKDENVRIVKIYLGSQWVDTVSGECVRERARQDKQFKRRVAL